MKSNVNKAIDSAYELIKRAWQDGGKHDINLALALDQLEPYVGKPYGVYEEERRAYRMEQMDTLINLDRLTEEETETILKCLLETDYEDMTVISDKIYEAAVWCGLAEKVYEE